ncbi:hypothetical protein PBS_02380 [Paraburkholderia sp. 2C]
MPKRTRVYPTSPVAQSDYVTEQKERVSARGKAESERARKRLDMEARVNVDASKWRYICLGD